MLDVEAPGRQVRRRISRKRGPCAGEEAVVLAGVDGGRADERGGAPMRMYTLVVRAAVHCLRRE
eukprot:3679448-Prorocentrum_lima.AAC.1